MIYCCISNIQWKLFQSWSFTGIFSSFICSSLKAVSNGILLNSCATEYVAAHLERKKKLCLPGNQVLSSVFSSSLLHVYWGIWASFFCCRWDALTKEIFFIYPKAMLKLNVLLQTVALNCHKNQTPYGVVFHSSCVCMQLKLTRLNRSTKQRGKTTPRTVAHFILQCYSSPPSRCFGSTGRQRVQETTFETPPSDAGFCGRRLNSTRTNRDSRWNFVNNSYTLF